MFDEATPQMLALLEDELTRMSRRIDCLTRNREAIADYLDAVRAHTSRGPARKDSRTTR